MHFQLVMGVISGYSDKKYEGEPAREIVARVWQIHQDEVFLERKILAPAVVTDYHDALVVYRTEWKCPEGGEVSALVQGHGNTLFEKDPQAWKEVVVEVVRRVKKTLGQHSVTIYFWDGIVDLRGEEIRSR